MLCRFSQYHEAIIDIMKKAFTNGDVIMMPVDAAFDEAIKQTKDKLKFPFISIYPTPTISIDKSNTSFANYREGRTMENKLPLYDKDGKYTGVTSKISKNVKNLYINIEYQVDVWSTKRDTCEELTQEMLFWLYENQEVPIEYQGHELRFTFTIGDNIQDNSDITNYEKQNKLYRYSFNILLTACIFRTNKYFNALQTDLSLSILEENN